MRSRGGRRNRRFSGVVVLAGLIWSWGPGTAPGRAETGPVEPPSPRVNLFYQDVAWSPDGSWIAFSGYAGSGEEYEPEKWSVYVARPDGSDRRLVAENAMWVSWSPDGGRLAFSSPRQGNWDLYSVAPDGSDPVRLTFHEAADTAPSWSPTGQEIAFTSKRDGNSEIYVLTLDGSGERRLTDNPAADHNPAWSPDGAGLVFYREAESGAADQIYWISADGETERQLTRNSDLNIFPAFLPDGRVTFSRKLAGSDEARLVVLDPASSTEVLVGPAGAFFGRWSPDGSEVLFIAGSWPTASLYVMSADDASPRRIDN